jgi:acyl-CoA dehydrogenase
MHQIQIACIARHGLHSPQVTKMLRDVATRQLLIASVTSEVGTGGDIRTSIAAIESDGDECRLEKHGSTVSYGEHADAFLVTARRAPDASPGDQVLVLLSRQATSIERTGPWDTLGMRGTCSPSLRVRSEFSPDQILPVSFGDICAETMVPISHLLWSACWLGIATDANRRARRYVRSRARSSLGAATGVPPATDPRLADAAMLLQVMRAGLDRYTRQYDARLCTSGSDGRNGDAPSAAFREMIEVNALKISSSELVVQIVALALSICGMAGYRADGPYSVERHLRDAYSASCMIGNERLRTANAVLTLTQRDEP